MPDSSQDEVEAIKSLRRQGLLTAKEAYERHLALLSASGVVVAALPARPATTEAASEVTAGPSPVWLQPFAVLVTLLGSVFGIVGVLFEELQAGLLVGPFVAAPVIEEALKPAGLYVLLLRWPHALLGRLHTAMLAALAGLCFALIESYVYVAWYFPDQDAGYVLFRFTVPVLMHTTASFLVGLGLSRGLIDWAAGREPLPKRTRNFYFAAVGLHAVYNIIAVVLSLTGVINFD